jgi:hypothetical protein
MRKFFKAQAESLTEMAAPSLPTGVKRKRSAMYAHTHDIHIGGEHVATISGHRPYNRRGLPAHVKEYHVHTNEHQMGYRQDQDPLDKYHPDHSRITTERQPTYETPKGENYARPNYDKMRDVKVQKPTVYHSMQDAVDAVVHTHKNNEEWGKGHDPRTRWAHAIKLSQGHDEHEKKADQYRTALHQAKALGHDDVINALQHHADAHAAKGSKPSEDKLKQWTHDAHAYTGTTHHHAKWSHDYKVKEKEAHTTKNHPEHHDLAVQAHNVYLHGHPHGPSWNRKDPTTGS